MTPEEKQSRIAAMLAGEMAGEQRWYYLSFVQDAFAGVCWVKAGGLITAIQAARDHGCNPGGEVLGVPLPFTVDPPDGSAYKLHTDKDVIDRLCAEWGDAQDGSPS